MRSEVCDISEELSSREACRERARGFGEERFVRQIKDKIIEVIDGA